MNVSLSPASFGKARLVIAAVLLLVVAAALFWVFRSRAAAAEFITQPVERGTIRNVVNATGTVQAVLTVQVGSQVSGIVESLHADFNSVVKRGQVLARLDARRYQAALEQAQANLQAAQARVATAQADLNSAIANRTSSQANVEAARVAHQNAARILERYEELRKDGILSQNDYDTAKSNADAAAARYQQALAQLEQVEAQINAARAQVEQAKAQVEQAQGSLRQAQIDLEYTTIRSPVDGVVVSRNVDVGQTVAASLSAPTLFVIANDLTRMQVNASVDEADIGSISDAEQVQFTVDAFPNRTFTGRIAEIRLEPVTVQNVTTYSVIINVDNDRLELKPGMTANISVTVSEVRDALKVPNAAMRYLPPGVTREDVMEMTRKAAAGPEAAAASLSAGTQTANAAETPVRTPPRFADRNLAGSGQSGARPNARSWAGNTRPGDAAAARTPRPGNQAPAVEGLAPGQLWDPTAKIQFPRRQERIARPGVVWVLGAQKKPEPRQILLGVTDGRFTEVVSGDLKEGEAVIVGDSTQAAAAQAQQPRGFPGPPGGGFIFGGRR